MCGEHLDYLDALWPDYESYHVSMNEVHFQHVSPGQYCKEPGQQAVELEVIHMPHAFLDKQGHVVYSQRSRQRSRRRLHVDHEASGSGSGGGGFGGDGDGASVGPSLQTMIGGLDSTNDQERNRVTRKNRQLRVAHSNDPATSISSGGLASRTLAGNGSGPLGVGVENSTSSSGRGSPMKRGKSTATAAAARGLEEGLGRDREKFKVVSVHMCRPMAA